MNKQNKILDNFFSDRAGINYFEYKEKPIIIYEDHRTILNVLFFLYKIGYLNINYVPNIISFDLHDDGQQSLNKSEIFDILKVKRFDDIDLKDFWSFVEFDCSGLDNDWVKTAMELNMIKDYVNIGGMYIENAEKGFYKNEDGIIHKLHILKHLDFELSEDSKGILCNLSDETLPIRNIFGYNTNIRNDFTDNQYPYILDFDLDCFTIQNPNIKSGISSEPLGVIWDEKTFKNMYQGFHDLFLKQFMECLILRSEIVTICMEPNYCNGYSNSIKILEYLDKYFFDGKLRLTI